MLRNTRKGFTLIELLIVVVIIGILASIAIPKFANTKDKAKVTGMKSDLRNLISLQESHFSVYARYASAIGDTPTTATVMFFQTNGVDISISAADPASGWSATATRTDLAIPMTCGLYLGNAASPHPSISAEGEVACW